MLFTAKPLVTMYLLCIMDNCVVISDEITLTFFSPPTYYLTTPETPGLVTYLVATALLGYSAEFVAQHTWPSHMPRSGGLSCAHHGG